MIDQIQRWSALAGLTATVADAGPPFRVRLQLEDIRPPMTVEVQGPAGAEDPYRFHTSFDLPSASISGLPAARVNEIVEAAVLGRSALADARRRNDGSGVEMIAVIYPDGLTRHTFMTAIYECQKLRQIITREVEAALVAESALASLLALAETSEDLAGTIAPGEASPAAPAPGVAPAPASPFAAQVAAPAPPVPMPAPTPAPAAWAPAAEPPPPSWPDLATPPPTVAPPVLPGEVPLSVNPLPDLSGPSAPDPAPTSLPYATDDDDPPRPTWDPPPLPNVPPPIPEGGGDAPS